MFTLSNTITRTDIYPIEIEKLTEDNMAIVFAKPIFFFQVACRWMELWFHYCITIAAESDLAMVDLKLKVK